jgi:hypothetical protein
MDYAGVMDNALVMPGGKMVMMGGNVRNVKMVFS